MRFRLVALLIVALYLAVPSAAFAIIKYRVVDLGSLSTGPDITQGYGINDAGQAIAVSYISTGMASFVWENGTITKLEGFPDGFVDHGFAYDINEHGHVVGESYPMEGVRATLWNGGEPINLGVLPGDDRSVAFSINDLGQIVGISGKKSEPAIWRGFIWSDGAMTEIVVDPDQESVLPQSINNAGQVVGIVRGLEPDVLGFLWDDGAITPLEYLASSINNNGWIGAAGAIYDGETWITDNPGVENPGPGSVFVNISALNDIGQGVGDDYSSSSGSSNAVLWDKENGTQILFELIDPNDPLKNLIGTLQEAADINNNGQIIIWNGHLKDGITRALLLNPITINTREVPLPQFAIFVLSLVLGLIVLREFAKT